MLICLSVEVISTISIEICEQKQIEHNANKSGTNGLYQVQRHSFLHTLIPNSHWGIARLLKEPDDRKAYLKRIVRVLYTMDLS